MPLCLLDDLPVRFLDWNQDAAHCEMRRLGGASVPTVHARAVRRAAEICGIHDLAARVGATHGQLTLWIQGVAEPPDAIFLRVVDVLCEYSMEQLKRKLRPDPVTPTGNDR